VIEIVMILIILEMKNVINVVVDEVDDQMNLVIDMKLVMQLLSGIRIIDIAVEVWVMDLIVARITKVFYLINNINEKFT
jgi:hypothetical protein